MADENANKQILNSERTQNNSNYFFKRQIGTVYILSYIWISFNVNITSKFLTSYLLYLLDR